MRTNQTNFILARPTVIIGVGGTGVNSIRKLKGLMGDNIPPQIRFLGIDTTEQNPNNDLPQLDTNEFVSAQVVEPDRYVTRTIHQTIKEWWPPSLEASKAIMRGAGQVRARGRLALFVNVHKIYTAIQNQIDEVISVNPERQRRIGVNTKSFADVYVICSLCGGTGSGMFLDIGLMVRDYLKHHQGQIRGMFVLPSIFERKAGTDWVRSNTYAALVELDHLMSASPSKVERVSYASDLRITVENPPFDRVYLLDQQNENNSGLTEISAMTAFIADVLHLMITSEFTSVEDDQFQNIETSQRIRKALGQKNQCYSSLGLSFVVAAPNDYKLEEVVKARRIIDDLLRTNFSSAGDFVDLDKDVEYFFGLNKLSKKEIRSVLSRKVRKEDYSFVPAMSDYTEDQIRQLTDDGFKEGKVERNLHSEIEELRASFEKILSERVNKYFEEFGSVLLAKEFCRRLLKKVENSLETFGPISQNFYFQQNGADDAVNDQTDEIEVSEEESSGFWSFNWLFGRNNQKTTSSEELAPMGTNNKHNTEYRRQYIDFRFQRAYEESAVQLLEKSRDILNEKIHKLEDISMKWLRLASSLDAKKMDLSDEKDRLHSSAKSQNQFKVTIPLLPEFKATWQGFVQYSQYNIDWHNRREPEYFEALTEYIRKEYEESDDGQRHRNKNDMIVQAINRLHAEGQGDLIKWKLNIAYDVATPLWTFSEASLPDRKTFERILYLGVPENFNQEKSAEFDIRDYVPLNEGRCDVLPMNGRQEIVFMRHVVGVPGFAVADDKSWAEKYWLDSEHLESHIWPEPWELEDLVPYDKYHFELIGKAQAYGLIPRGITPQEHFEELLTGYNRSGSLFNLYSDLLCNTTHQMLEFLEAVLEVFESKQESTHLTPNQNDLILQKRNEKSKDSEALIKKHINWIKSELNRPEVEAPLPTPLKRFYSKMLHYLDLEASTSKSMQDS